MRERGIRRVGLGVQHRASRTMLLPSNGVMRTPVKPRCAPRLDLNLVPPGGVGQLAQMLGYNFALEGAAFGIVVFAAFLARVPFLNASEQDEDRERSYTAALCRQDGWQLRCDISGETTLLRPSQRGVGLDFGLGFTCDDQPFFGSCRLLRPSRFLTETGSRWRIDGPQDGGRILEFRVRCESDITTGENVLVGKGTNLYFKALLVEAGDSEAARRAAALRGTPDVGGYAFTDGDISVLEDSGPWGPELNLATGSARLIRVGSFEANPAPSNRNSTHPRRNESA